MSGKHFRMQHPRAMRARSSLSCASGVAVLQIDFGLDSTGKEILTLTNREETILCDSKGRHQQVFLVQHTSSIPRAHNTLGKMIRPAGTVAPAPPVSALQAQAPPAPAPPAPAPPATPDALYSWFQVGHKVHVTDTLKAYREFKDNLGIICRIVKARHFLVSGRTRTTSWCSRLASSRDT